MPAASGDMRIPFGFRRQATNTADGSDQVPLLRPLSDPWDPLSYPWSRIAWSRAAAADGVALTPHAASTGRRPPRAALTVLASAHTRLRKP